MDLPAPTRCCCTNQVHVHNNILTSFWTMAMTAELCWIGALCLVDLLFHRCTPTCGGENVGPSAQAGGNHDGHATNYRDNSQGHIDKAVASIIDTQDQPASGKGVQTATLRNPEICCQQLKGGKRPPPPRFQPY